MVFLVRRSPLATAASCQPAGAHLTDIIATQAHPGDVLEASDGAQRAIIRGQRLPHQLL